jgi:threonine/homoserine/homoserine lactone efflux protein
MVFLSLFVTSFIIAFSGAMMPGPLLTLTIGESVRKGPWVGPRLILGHAILEGILIVALLLGMAPLFQHDVFFILIALIGGGILFWMAWSMFSNLNKLTIHTAVTSSKTSNIYLAGALMSLANPYWIIWWATIGLGYVLHSQKYGMIGIALFFIGHILGDLVWYSAISWTVGKGRQLFNLKTYRILIGSCATFLVAFAFWLIYDGIDKLKEL